MIGCNPVTGRTKGLTTHLNMVYNSGSLHHLLSLMSNLTLPQKSVRRSVGLPPDFWKVASKLGNGNATLGIKRALIAVSQVIKQESKCPDQ